MVSFGGVFSIPTMENMTHTVFRGIGEKFCLDINGRQIPAGMHYIPGNKMTVWKFKDYGIFKAMHLRLIL